MKLFEITSPKTLYHGSPLPLKIGKVYRVRHWRSTDQGGISNEVEITLEKCRPKNAISRNKAFYMIDKFTTDAIDLTGGRTDYVYAVSPVGRVDRHDLQWVNDLDSVLRPDKFNNKDRLSYSFHMPPIFKSEVPATIEDLTEKYWSGVKYPYKDWAHWEYLSPSFKVLKLVHKDD